MKEKRNRFPYRRELYIRPDGEVWVSISGTMASGFAKVCAPTVEEIRGMLFRLRSEQEWSRGTLAGVLGVPLVSLRRWEDGTRRPCGAARKLIWLMFALFCQPDLLKGDLRSIISWGSWENGFSKHDQPTGV